MFKMKKNEQNENILYLSGILNYHIMFTIFKFQLFFILMIIKKGTG